MQCGADFTLNFLLAQGDAVNVSPSSRTARCVLAPLVGRITDPRPPLWRACEPSGAFFCLMESMPDFGRIPREMKRERVEPVELRAGAGPRGRVRAMGIFNQPEGLHSQTGTVEIVGGRAFPFADVDCLQSMDHVYWGNIEDDEGPVVKFHIDSSAALDSVDFG